MDSSERLRLYLKQDLIALRSVYFRGIGRCAICPLCGKPILSYEAVDLHEALITRGDVARQVNQSLIYHRCNCVVVHHICHMQIAGHGGDIGFEKCARQIVAFERRQAVHAWLMAMQQYFPQAARKALRRFEAIDFIGSS